MLLGHTRARVAAASAAIAALLLSSSALAWAGATAGPAAALDGRLASAESNLRSGELQIAESHYRSALLEGWLLIGILDRIEGRVPEAREAFLRAASSAADDRLPLLSLAIADLQLGKAPEAVEILTRLRRRIPNDVQTRRLLAQALAVNGQPEQALRELAALCAAHPADLELAFALASTYLQQKRVDDAARLFAKITAARPIPQTHVLIGRAYRDSAEYARARSELLRALRRDPRVPRAHYNLGMTAVKERGTAALDEAIAEFEEELRLTPGDPVTSFELGVALVEGQRPEEALAPLEIAIPAFDPPQARPYFYLGRAQLGANRPADAARSLQRALDLAQAQGAGADALKMIRLQLGQALRRIGRADEAAEQFAEAQRLSLSGAEAERAQMARHLAGLPEPEGPAASPAVPVIEASPLASLAASERAALRRRVSSALARSYFNLGVIQARGERFARAAEQFEQAAALDPGFPQVQSSLGLAYFNARRFREATSPLVRALETSPDDANLKRMLAMAYLESQDHAKAADLLRGDPELDRNPSLQFAYGLALVRSDRASEAELVFSRLFSRHGSSAELSVLLGQAYAQQGDFDRAVDSLQRALRLQPDVSGANATLGVIYLRQGKHADAEAALRAELARNPGDLQSQQNLAVVLESEQRPEEAIPLLRGILQSKPEFADARYLLGKILLAQGEAVEAVEHLEAAARLAPEDANNRYQLGRAYQKLGRTEQAQREFDLFREIKSKR